MHTSLYQPLSDLCWGPREQKVCFRDLLLVDAFIDILLINMLGYSLTITASFLFLLFRRPPTAAVRVIIIRTEDARLH